MKFKNIIIKNFRQYQDIDIDLSENSEYDLNYILAENGIGKTTLLNAITWCLYGEELHVSETLKDKTLPLLTLKTSRDMDISQEAETSVELTIEDSEGEIAFKRIKVFRKTEEGKPYEKNTSVKLIKSPNYLMPDVLVNEDEFRQEVNRRLPRKIQQFFFFDGEQLDTYLATSTSASVEDAVLQTSQIDLLIGMKKNLINVTGDLRKTISKGNTKAKDHNDEYEKKRTEVESLKNNINKLQDDCNKAKIELANIKTELGDDPDINSLEENRKDLIIQQSSLKDSIIKNNSDFREFLKNKYMLFAALPRLRNMYDFIKEKESNEELPPKYDKKELEQMLANNVCGVCGQSLSIEGSNRIKALISRYLMGQETGIVLTKILGPIEILIKSLNNYEIERDAFSSNQLRFETELKNINDQIKKIDNTVNKYSNKQRITSLYLKRAELENFVEDTLKDIGKNKALLDNAENMMNSEYKQWQSALKVDKKHAELKKQIMLAERASKKVSDIIDSIKSRVRTKISNEMSSKFHELMWKKKFGDVKLSENYSASVTNIDGYECLGSCSAAERELLALAFTLALHKESGFDGPLVIDTPLSRISGDLRSAFAKVLKSVSKTKQILLFLTEDEYSDNVKSIFEPIANNKYRFTLKNEEFVEKGDL